MRKTSPDAYAEAFLAVAENAGDKSAIIKRFVGAIQRRNDWSWRGHILEACEKKWRRAHGKSLVTIESARELLPAQRTRLTSQWKNKTHDVEFKINPSLIAGVRILINDERQFDGSLKRKLAELFS